MCTDYFAVTLKMEGLSYKILSSAKYTVES